MRTNLIITIAIAIITGLITYKNRKNSSLSKVTILLIGLFMIIVSLIYPIYDEAESKIQRIVISILYSIQCIYVGQDFEMIQNAIDTHNISSIYIFVLYTSFLLAPILTTGVIISLIENEMSKIKYKISMLRPSKKELYVFSQINDESVKLAEEIYNKSIIVFCNEDNEVNKTLVNKIKKINGIIIKNNELELKIRNKKATFYEINEDEIKNIDISMKLIEKYQENSKIKVVIFSTRKEAEMLIDSIKRKMRVELVNKNKYALYNLLEKRPIIKWSKNNKISVLISGEEKKTIEIIKMIFWSMQIDGYELEIKVVGNNANYIKTMFYHQCPGMKDEKYNIQFIVADIQTEEFDIALEKYCQDVNYVILAMEDDKLNIETAIFLRKHFMYMDKKNFSNKPAINIWLNNELHGINKLEINDNNYAKSKEDYQKVSYELYTFGTIEQIYKQVSKYNNELEDFALIMHLANVGVLAKDSKSKEVEVAIQTFKNREKTRKYSIASAIHMKYSLYSKGINLFNNEINYAIINKVQEMVNEENQMYSFMRSYARMWNVFWRTEGYRRVSFEEATIYYRNGISRTQQHEMAKLNPCLTDLDEFEENEIKMTELYGRKVELLKAEKNYTKFFPMILERILKLRREQKNEH